MIKKTPNNGRHSSGLWLYGKHPCLAAIGNPLRKINRILVTSKMAEEIAEYKLQNVEVVKADSIERYVPQDALHQGIAMEVKPLEVRKIKEVYHEGTLVLLDQITDPHNVGAIMRSCAAFGAKAIIMPDNNSPQESGVMAKSASGALEIVPIIKVTNLVKVIKELKKQGFWFIGMDGLSQMSIKDVPSYEKKVIVMGAEGKGLRRLTAENCDILAKLPISRTVESLNVSNAAAIALYELSS